MKANELMIGDWVRKLEPGGHTIPVKVTGIIDEDNSVLFERRDGVHGVTDIKSFEPIPLTKEILEKNGFELREGCTTAWDWLDGEKSVHISGDHTCPIGQTVTIYTPGGCAGAAFSSHRTLSDHKIRGVHELQHALRLCGIEKEIEL